MPDSRPRLKGTRYKYLTSCSRLLGPSSHFSHAHTHTHHQPDSSCPGLAQWACHKKASAHGSRVGWTPARRNKYDTIWYSTSTIRYDTVHYIYVRQKADK